MELKIKFWPHSSNFGDIFLPIFINLTIFSFKIKTKMTHSPSCHLGPEVFRFWHQTSPPKKNFRFWRSQFPALTSPALSMNPPLITVAHFSEFFRFQHLISPEIFQVSALKFNWIESESSMPLRPFTNSIEKRQYHNVNLPNTLISIKNSKPTYLKKHQLTFNSMQCDIQFKQ